MLARELGMTVARLEEEMTDREFTVWDRFFLRLSDEAKEAS